MCVCVCVRACVYVSACVPDNVCVCYTPGGERCKSACVCMACVPVVYKQLFLSVNPTVRRIVTD